MNNYNKLEITNTAKDRYPNAKIDLSEIRFLTSSQECSFLEILAGLDYNQIEPIEDKLFNKFKIDDKEPIPPTLFLKNKYLYMFTEGAINYLEALVGMEEAKQPLHDLEVSEIVGILLNKAQFGNLSIISLGAGTSDKEIEIFNELINRGFDHQIHYLPLDVSTYLLQLGLLKFNNEFFKKKEKISINPIIADFWDAALAVNEDVDIFKTPADRKRIFLFLGGTFGNYHEKELLDQIIQLMNVDEEVLIGLDIQTNPTEIEKKIIFKNYNTLGNLQWLLQPLYHIPWYSGYCSRFRFLQFSEDDCILDESHDDKKFCSAIPDSICYAPSIKIKSLQIPYDGRDYLTLDKIRLATSTKYLKESLIDWIENYNFNHQYKFEITMKKFKDTSGLLCLKKIEEKTIEVGEDI